MAELLRHFIRESVVDVDAAIVGMAREHWTCVDATAHEERVQAEMRQDHHLNI